MKHFTRLWQPFIAGCLLTGCAKTAPEEPVDAADPPMTSVTETNSTSEADMDEEQPVTETNPPDAIASENVSMDNAEQPTAEPDTLLKGQAEPITAWAEQFNNIFRSDSHYFAGIPTEQGIHSAAVDGVTVVISLLPDEQLNFVKFDLPSVLEELGIRYVRIPFVTDTFDKADVEHFAAVLDETDGSVLTHCGSSNRVGALWAAYLHHYREVEIETAIEIGRSAGLRSDALVDAVRRIAASP